jgi:hypothetical protein
MAALGGIIGGAIVPITMTMVKWGQTYDERSLNLKQKHRDEASELLRTYGLTSAIVAPLTSWTGFMAGGGYRQQPVRALLCGVGAAAISYPVGSYLGRAVADPVLNSDKGTPRYPDRTIFLGSLVWTGVIASSTIAGVAIGGGAIIRKTRDPGYALMVVPDGKNTLLVHSFSGQF